jgi:hypothetical protein
MHCLTGGLISNVHLSPVLGACRCQRLTAACISVIKHHTVARYMNLCHVLYCAAVRHQGTQAVHAPCTARRVPHDGLVGCHNSSSTGSADIGQEPSCTAAWG